MNTSADRSWPPDHAPAFVGSERFGQMLLTLADDLQRRYADLDFVGATGLVWDWFIRKATSNPDWLVGRQSKFASEGHLRAYVRQALWRTAANERRRERRRRRHFNRLPLSFEPIAPDSSAASELELRELAEALPIPLNAVVHGIVFAERELDAVAADLNTTSRRVAELYETALDLIDSRMLGEAKVKEGKRKRRNRDRQGILRRAAFASPGRASASASCETRYAAQGLSRLEASLICKIVDGGRDPVIVACELNLDIGELNRTFDEAMNKLA